jgi:hypothetical protein
VFSYYFVILDGYDRFDPKTLHIHICIYIQYIIYAHLDIVGLILFCCTSCLDWLIIITTLTSRTAGLLIEGSTDNYSLIHLYLCIH